MAQVPTTLVTPSWIMSRRTFMQGVDDLRAGREFPSDYDSWRNHKDAQWCYERGRLWAAVAPRGMPVKIKGKLNPKAIEVYMRCHDII
jgi:hypothetical protein